MPTLGLCVIAKNSAPTLRACLDSVRGLVQTMVVVDTGSTDGTEAIAREAGATVLSFAWTNDFAAARNAGLQAMETDWVLVLDADEELDRKAHAWIRKELRHPRAEGYVVPVRNYLPPWNEVLPGHILLPREQRHRRAPDAAIYSHSEVCRLYRRRPDVFYIGHIHEQVEYRMMELGLPIAHAPFFIHHFGWYRIDADGLRRKWALYTELLAEKLRLRPDDAQVMVQYGDALSSWQGKHQEGLSYFMRAASLAPERHGVWMHIGMTLLKLGQPEAALVAIERIAGDEKDGGRKAQLLGEACIGLGRWQQALEAYREAARLQPGHLVVRVRLASIEMEHGNREVGLTLLRAAAVQGESEVRRHASTTAVLQIADIYARLEQWPDVQRHVQAALLRDPDAPALQDVRLKAAVATGNLHEAAEAAARLAELAPSPRSVLRHVAILHQIGNGTAAEDAILRGLEQFPVSDELQAAKLELEQGHALATA